MTVLPFFWSVEIMKSLVFPSLGQESHTWWMPDEDQADLWWWWSPTRGYHRWRPYDQAAEATGGWANKAAALVYMQQQGHQECIEFALRKLQRHPGLQGALQKVKKLYEAKGVQCYEQYFGI